ncbi:terminase [Corynebacterium kalidii]
MTAEPRFHTERDPSRRSLGPKLGKLAAALGKPLMPWQQRAADVALELDPSGRFHYKEVIITVPRQSGKTAMVLMLAAHRMLTTPEGKVWYTAQSGQIARERFTKDLVPPVVRLLGGAVSVKYGAGDTRMEFPAIGSQIRPHPPTADSLHSEQSDLNIIDEPWSYTEAQGDALVQAFIPTQNTRPNAQTVYLSTMGDATSTWWHSKVDAARLGTDPTTCIIDWGVPEGTDGADVEAIIAAHPAVGHTIEADTVRGAVAKMKPSEAARAYGNQRTATRAAVFSADVLARVIVEDATMTAGSPLAFGVAVSWDRSTTVIVACGYDSAGAPVAEVIDARPGTTWATARITELAAKWRPLSVMVDARSPASTIATDPALDTVLTVPESRTVSAGTAELLARVRDGSMRIRFDAEVVKAFDVLALRTVGDLGQMLDRRRSAGSIAHVEATMLAMAGLMQAPPPAPKPKIVSL